MKDLRSRVAVVTGAASGIGRGLAERFVAEGMRVVLVDIDAAPLDVVAEALRERGAAVVALAVDVSDPAAMRTVADVAIEAWGVVDVVCNNAGVGIRGLVWERSEADWEWLLGVNLWSVVRSAATFVPLMLEQGGGHIVNTASIAGLLPGARSALYNTSKSAVVALSESLALDLAEIQAPIGVSVLCPGFVRTDILAAPRHRPSRWTSDEATSPPSAEEVALEERYRTGIAAGTDPAVIAEMVVDAIRNERFWVLPHTQYAPQMQARLDAILDAGPPA
ncbi:MAG: family NAD(P)-dependent oxidoreductase [Acidimicrobiales bacterium]|nr:family NAD(P)-dependent oxidoreductase [Acidimicrobiales bacterium]